MKWMMENNKKKNIVFVEALVVLWSLLLLIAVKALNPNNDMYFLASTGRYIVEHGIPRINPFCVDEGLKIIVQQWFGSIIDYYVFEYLGNAGVVALACMYMMLETLVMCLFLTNYTKSRQVLLLTIVVSSVSQIEFYNTRGSIVTSCIILLEVFLLTRYGRTGEKKYLMFLPFISLFLINWQSSAWPMMYIFVLPFLMPDKVDVIVTGIRKHYRENRKHYLPILAVLMPSVVCGFVNPYGIDGILYIFRSGSSLSNQVQEFRPPEVGSYYMLATVISFASLCIYLTKKGVEADLRLVFLCLGSIFISCTMKRNVWYGVVALPTFAILMDGFVKTESWRGVVRVLRPPSKAAYGFLVGYMAVFAVFMLCLTSVKPYSAMSGETDNSFTPIKAVEYLDGLESKEDIKVLSSFNNGGFFEWHGYKVFIDARPEIYNSVINEKKDVWTTFSAMYDGLADYGAILEEYNFTHIFAERGSSFYYYMESNTDYTPVISEEDLSYQFYERAY